MRNFSWNCFAVTGSIDAYLLFKETEMIFTDKDEKNGTNHEGSHRSEENE
nr:YqzL family protein [Melghirimyces algeriensis]